MKNLNLRALLRRGGDARNGRASPATGRASTPAERVTDERFRTVMESSPDGMCLLDTEARITDSNAEACRILERRQDDLAGLDFRRLLSAGSRGAAQAWLESSKQHGQADGEFDMVGPTGRHSTLWVRAAAIPGPGNAPCLVIHIRDLAEGERFDRLKDEFITLVSHELRSPLTVIMGAVNTALSEADQLTGEESRQLLRDAALETESLSEVLGNLLELTRAQVGRLVLHIEPLDIEGVIRATVERLQRQTLRHHLSVDIDEDIPVTHADPIRVERILRNLLEEAVKHSARGDSIAVSAARRGVNLEITVTASSAGRTQEGEERGSEPFQGLDSSGRGDWGGAGLGLAVCRHLVAAHGGHIRAEPCTARGSAVSFTLPGATRRLQVPTHQM